MAENTPAETTTEERFTVDRELKEGEYHCVRGSDGALIMIFCWMGGTQVTIYEDADHNPLAEIYTHHWTKNEGTQGDQV